MAEDFYANPPPAEEGDAFELDGYRSPRVPARSDWADWACVLTSTEMGHSS